MDEARAVLTRLDRIEALDRRQASPGVLLAELRELVAEAEQWARRERDEGALSAASRTRAALEIPTGRRRDHQERGSTSSSWQPIAPLG
jgi:hypothetical protein